MQRKDYRRIIGDITALSLILFFFLGAIHFWCFNQKFYDSEHAKLTLYGKSISDHIGISEEDLKDLTAFTLAYLNDKDASLDLQMNVKGTMREVFTDDERAHMVDVRRLNLAANALCIASLIVFILGTVYYLIRKYPLQDLYRSYVRVLKYVMLFIAVLGAWILIDFDSFWTMFHHVFFPGNDLWILDLRKDILIMIVPPEFFNHLVIRIVLNAVFLLFFFYCLFVILSKRKENA